MASNFQYEYRTLPASAHRRLARTLKSSRTIVHGDFTPDWLFYTGRGLLALLLGFFLWIAMSAKLGDPLKDEGWTDTGAMIWYAIWTAALLYVLLSCLRRYRLSKQFQFSPGRYLLPFTLIDARSSRIEVFDLMQMTRFEAQHHTRNGRYDKTVLTLAFQDGPTQTFKLQGKKLTEQVLQRFEQLQAAGRSAFDRRDIAALRGFDPLVDLRTTKWVNPEADRHPPAPGRLQQALRHRATISVAAALLLAPLLWLGRNSLGDVRMQAQAQHLATEEAYLGYIAHGRFHVDTMRAALPRVAFEEVKGKHSVTALREVLKKYPQGGLQADVAAEIHVLYQKALQRFKEQAVQSDASLVASMEKLLDQAEHSGNPRVPIQFIRPTAEAMQRMDDALRDKGAKLHGLQIIPAAAYFSESSASVREQRIVSGLQQAFGSIFPGDVLKFAPGGAKDGQAPMLQIRYQIDPSGAIYEEEKGTRGFVGLVARFQAGLVVPDLVDQWRFQLEVEPPQHFNVEYKTGAGQAAGPSDGQVYAVMAERAFDSLAAKIMAAFFKPDSQVVLRQLRPRAALGGGARPAYTP